MTSVGNTADCVVSGVVHGCGVGDRDRKYAVRQNVNIEWEVGEGRGGPMGHTGYKSGGGRPRVCRETECEHKVMTRSPTVV